MNLHDQYQLLMWSANSIDVGRNGKWATCECVDISDQNPSMMIPWSRNDSEQFIFHNPISQFIRLHFHLSVDGEISQKVGKLQLIDDSGVSNGNQLSNVV